MTKKAYRRSRKKVQEPELIPKSWFKAAGIVLAGVLLFYLFRDPVLYLIKSSTRFPYLAHKAEEWLDANSIHKIRPKGYNVYGIDVSHHQQEIEWEQLRQEKIAFIFMKATEGTNHHDKYFKRHWDDAYKHGIMRGAYHFFLPSRDAEEQAKHFISQVKLRYGDLPPVLDVEVTNRRSSEEIRKGTKTWLDAVEKHYGIKPIIYTNYSFYQEHLAGHFDDYLLWVAHYNTEKFIKKNYANWAFWQHSEKGKLKGIKGAVDCNVFHGSMKELEDLCYMPELN